MSDQDTTSKTQELDPDSQVQVETAFQLSGPPADEEIFHTRLPVEIKNLNEAVLLLAEKLDLGDEVQNLLDRPPQN